MTRRSHMHVRITDRRRRIALALLALLAAGCAGGGEEPAPTTASLQAVGSTTLSGVAGNSVAAISVIATTTAGAPVDRVVITWSPSAGTVTPATSSTSTAGMASTTWTLGTVAGTQTLTATTSGGVSRTFTATVTPDRAATVTITRDASVTLVPGASTTFTATSRDRYGNAVATKVAWATSNTAVATIDSTGRLAALLPGTATITALADTARGQTTITVGSLAAVTLTSVNADTLTPGKTIAIAGTGFVPNATTVIIGGLLANVISSTTTQVVAQVPSAASYPCRTPAPMLVAVRRVVASDTTIATINVPFDGTTRIVLNAGERAVVSDASAASCVRVASAGNYVMAVVNAATTVPGGVAVRLNGSAVGGPLAAQSARAPATARYTRPSRQVGLVDTHAEHLERERREVASLGAPTYGRSRSAVGALRALATPSVGDVMTVNAMFFDCAVPTAIRARVAAVGTRSIVLEDVAAPNAGANDATLRQLADEFDRVDYPLVTQYFGDPLAIDAKFGGDGHVRMLFTPYVVDSVPNTIGFVTSCNLYPRAQLASSNEASVFYARLPKPNESIAEWRFNLRGTIVHETKHLAAYAERFARAGAAGPVLEEGWLEEATARVSEELYARTFSGATWKGNATYAPTVGCELSRCDDRPLGMYKHFEAVADFYSRIDSLTPLGGVSRFDGTYYGSGWLLTRWAADQFASDEPTFFRALTTETTVTGLQNLAKRTGRTSSAMLPDWALAMAVDDRPNFVPRAAELTIPSWNTRDVLRGLNAYGPFQFRSPFPLLVRQATSPTFTVDIPLLRSYTAAYTELTGAPVGALLSVRAPNGGTAPDGVGLAIVRVP